jgi:hypothetical protein
MKKTACIRRKALLAALLVAVIALLPCCRGSVRLGWVETSSPGHITASYSEFTGTEVRTIQAQAGDTLCLEYEDEVDRGNLRLEVEDPFGQTIWCESLCENCCQSEALPVDEPGCYTILVWGEETAGSFDLAWAKR